MWPDRTGYRIAQGWIDPDVSVSWPDQQRDERYLLGSPMIAIEIISPGEEIDSKLTLYFAEGAMEVWVIDAKRKALTLYSTRGRSGYSSRDRLRVSLRGRAGGFFSG